MRYVMLRFSDDYHVEMHVTNAWAAITLNPSEQCLRNEKGKSIFLIIIALYRIPVYFRFHLHVSFGASVHCMLQG